MFAGMTWNLENFERPAANAEQAIKDRYARKLKQISDLVTAAGPDLVGVQEVLAHNDDLAPGVFDELRAELGTGCRPPRSTTTEPKSPRPSGGRWRSPTPAVTGCRCMP